MLTGLAAGMFLGCALLLVFGTAAADPFADDAGLFCCTGGGLSARTGWFGLTDVFAPPLAGGMLAGLFAGTLAGSVCLAATGWTTGR